MQEKIKKITVSLADRTEVQKVPVDPSTQTDNSFDYSKVVVKKPWGYEYLMYQNAHMAVWILYIKKGNRTSMHCHPKKKTSLVVLSGEAICSTLGERMKRTTSEGLLMDKGVFHSTESVSDSGTFVMEIETPNHKRDLVRLEDKYGRVGKGYESVSEMSFNLDNYNYITFIESKIYYNVRKKFGTCSLSLAKFRTYEEFKNNFELKGWDAVSIVKGKILDGRGAVILDVGDTVDLETIKSFQNIQIDGEIEVIVIKRRDTMVKLSDYVVTFIEKEKVRDVFLVPGRPNAHIIDSIGRNTNMRYVCFKSEEAATMAAEGASKLSNRPAVVVLSSGASGTNALTGVADAWVDSTPLLVISGQTRTDEITSGAVRQLGIQELDIVQIVRPITKYAVRIEDANSIRYHLEKAVHLARTGRPGPVWIDLPSDLQGMDIDEDELKPFQPPGSPGSGGDGETDEKIEEAIRLVREAERPVLLAGNGIRLAGAQQSFLELVDRLALPVLTSRRGADLMPDDHPLFFGRPGTYGQRSANFVIQNADVILSIGSRLSLPQIGRNPKAFARAARLIVVDIDKHELGKPTIRPYQAICCSAGEMIRRMQEKLSEGQRRDISAWIQRCREWRSKYTEPRPNGHPPEDRLDAYAFIRILSQSLKPGEIVCVDGKAPLTFVMHSFRFKEGQRLISASGLENTSFALPAAMGSCINSNGREIVCLCEYRGFQKNAQELETVNKYRLPIKIFILDTGGYYIKDTQQDYFGGRYVASESEEGITAPDIRQIGAAYNLPAFQLSTRRDLESNLPEIVQKPGPFICDVRIDKSQKFEPKIVYTVKPDGKWIAKPLEDMYPFLDREELKANMIVDLLEEE